MAKVCVTSLVCRARAGECLHGLFALRTFTGFRLRTCDRLGCRFVMEPRRLTLGKCRARAGRRFQYSIDLDLDGFDLLGAGTCACGCNKPYREHRLDTENDCENASPASWCAFRFGCGTVCFIGTRRNSNSRLCETAQNFDPPAEVPEAQRSQRTVVCKKCWSGSGYEG